MWQLVKEAAPGFMVRYQQFPPDWGGCAIAASGKYIAGCADVESFIILITLMVSK